MVGAATAMVAAAFTLGAAPATAATTGSVTMTYNGTNAPGTPINAANQGTVCHILNSNTGVIINYIHNGASNQVYRFYDAKDCNGSDYLVALSPGTSDNFGGAQFVGAYSAYAAPGA